MPKALVWRSVCVLLLNQVIFDGITAFQLLWATSHWPPWIFFPAPSLQWGQEVLNCSDFCNGFLSSPLFSRVIEICFHLKIDNKKFFFTSGNSKLFLCFWAFFLTQSLSERIFCVLPLLCAWVTPGWPLLPRDRNICSSSCRPVSAFGRQASPGTLSRLWRDHGVKIQGRAAAPGPKRERGGKGPGFACKGRDPGPKEAGRAGWAASYPLSYIERGISGQHHNQVGL